jgi:hypothetical protein
MSKKVGKVIGKVGIGRSVYYARLIKRRKNEKESKQRVALFSSPSSNRQLRQMDFSVLMRFRMNENPFNEENYRPPYVNKR